MIDHLAFDGLSCAFEGWPMGNAADHIAQKHGISRQEQDRFAVQSHQRAAEATEKGLFAEEIVPLTADGDVTGLTIVRLDVRDSSSDPLSLATFEISDVADFSGAVSSVPVDTVSNPHFPAGGISDLLSDSTVITE